MDIDIVTIFPQFFSPLELSLIGKAQRSKNVSIQTYDLRHWAADVHASVDDKPYGGGPGMLMKPDVWGQAIDHIDAGYSGGSANCPIIVPSPTGQVLTQKIAQELSSSDRLLFACGRYEGIDNRVIEYYSPRICEISLGDYVLLGGEVAVLVILEAMIRLIPGVLGNGQSHKDDSFQESLLEGPQYTRPEVWRGLSVPPVLLSGNHQKIREWNKEQSEARTQKNRPDLWSIYVESRLS